VTMLLKPQNLYKSRAAGSVPPGKGRELYSKAAAFQSAARWGAQ
jgi:hypothetical protein